MGLCDGNWRSEIKLDKKAVDAAPTKYEADGLLHICPSIGKDIRGQQTVILANGGSMVCPLEKGATCDPTAEEGRFEIKYQRKGPDEELYQYEGTGRVFNEGRGPGFIHGRVTITPEEGGGTDTGVWEAVRVGGHGGGPGPGEGPDAAPSEETVPGVVKK